MFCCDISTFFTIIGAVASIVSVIVAIRIARRIPDKDILSHRQRIRSLVKDLHQQKRSGKRNYKIRIIDIDKFDKYYPEVFEKHAVRSYQNGELVGTDIKGIQVTDGVIGAVPHRKKENVFVATKKDSDYTIERVGLIPYRWIVDIDLDGDELEGSAIIYCKFKRCRPAFFHKFYLTPKGDGKMIWKRRIVRRYTPYESFSYYLIEERNNETGERKKIDSSLRVTVKGDDPLFP